MIRYTIGIAIGLVGIVIENPIITLVGIALALTYFIGRLRGQD